MDIVAIIIIILISLILVVTFYIIGLYNNLIDAKNKIEDQFIQIDTELKLKIDTVRNIIEILKNITRHEEKIIKELENTTTKLEKSKNINDKITLASNLNRTLNKVNTLKETYTELNKHKLFLSHLEKLEESEDKINYARTFYNDVVLKYNNLRKQFPSNIIAKAFNFKEINYYK